MSWLQYDTIGRKIVTRIPIEQLSGRDKVNLFQHLMEDLGIAQRFSDKPDETGEAQKIMTEQWDIHWNAK